MSWQIAHQVVEIAKREGKAIVVENLENKGLLEKIEIVGKRNGVQVIKVNPAYTLPCLGIDKDVAGAYVISRRGLEFKESLPKNYRKLLEDKEKVLNLMRKFSSMVRNC